MSIAKDLEKIESSHDKENLRDLIRRKKFSAALVLCSLRCPDIRPYIAIGSNCGLDAIPKEIQNKARRYGWRFYLRYNRMFWGDR